MKLIGFPCIAQILASNSGLFPTVWFLGPNVRQGEFPKVEHVDGKFLVTFQFWGDQNTKTVSVAGTFNAWNKDRNPMDGPNGEGLFTTTIEMNMGIHEYKFVINGEHWTFDPENADRTGPYNNTLVRIRTSSIFTSNFSGLNAATFAPKASKARVQVEDGVEKSEGLILCAHFQPNDSIEKLVCRPFRPSRFMLYSYRGLRPRQRLCQPFGLKTRR